jgi:hypothetical protein
LCFFFRHDDKVRGAGCARTFETLFRNNVATPQPSPLRPRFTSSPARVTGQWRSIAFSLFPKGIVFFFLLEAVYNHLKQLELLDFEF